MVRKKQEIVPPRFTPGWWLDITAYDAQERGQSLEYARAHARRLRSVFEAVLGPMDAWPLRQWAGVLARHFHKLSAAELRQKIRDAVLQGDVGEVEQYMRAAFNYRRQAGQPLGPEAERFLLMSPAEAARHLRSSVVGRLEGLPLTQWALLREYMLRVCAWAAACPAETLFGQMEEALCCGVWCMLGVILEDAEQAGRGWNSPQNQACIRQVEYWLGWHNDDESGVGALWDMGLRAGAPNKSWKDLRQSPEHTAQSEEARERSQQAVRDVIDILIDCLRHHSSSEILEMGAREELIPYLKKGTWRDRQDRDKAGKAQRIIPKDKIQTFSELTADSSGEEEGSADEVVSAQVPADRLPRINLDQIEAGLVLDKMMQEPSLTPREKDVLRATREIRQNDEEPTFEKIAARLGCSKTRTKQLYDSLVKKLRRGYPDLLSD